jgi:hypothetical protein
MYGPKDSRNEFAYVRYRIAGSRQREHTAWVHHSRLNGARDWVEGQLGLLAVWRSPDQVDLSVYQPSNGADLASAGASANFGVASLTVGTLTSART